MINRALGWEKNRGVSVLRIAIGGLYPATGEVPGMSSFILELLVTLKRIH